MRYHENILSIACQHADMWIFSEIRGTYHDGAGIGHIRVLS